MAHYRRSRDGFKDQAQFFQGMEADYSNLRLDQYGIDKTEYFALIQQLKDEINYTE